VLRQILVHHVDVWVRSPDVPKAPWTCLPAGSIRPVGLADDEGLLPQNPATYSGYRLLTEYFAFPQRFLFFEIMGLREAVARCDGRRLQMVITLNQSEPELENHVDATTFDLYCTPVVNLFEKRADRISLSDRSAEFQVVVDRTKPLDYEVHTVLSVSGYRAGSPEEQSFLPFYLAQDSDEGGDAFFTVNRVQRLPSEREKRFGQLSSYGGSEVFLSLVDAACAPYPGRLEQLGVTTLCTNRHLPISVGRLDGTRDLLVEMNGPVRAARCIAGPTSPRESFARGDTAWRIVSHLSLNYSSIIDVPGQNGAAMLRGLLELYCAPQDRHFTKQIAGIESVTSVPILRRMPVPGMIHFGRGIEVTVLFDEDAFVGTGVFLLGMVLDHFFARIASINSFVETVIQTKQRGELTRWPTRIGTKHIL
jgi:type VI secretion system protein ImpG